MSDNKPKEFKHSRICVKCARALGAKMDGGVATMSKETCARCGEEKYTMSMVKWGLYDLPKRGKK